MGPKNKGNFVDSQAVIAAAAAAAGTGTETGTKGNSDAPADTIAETVKGENSVAAPASPPSHSQCKCQHQWQPQW